MIAVKVSLIGRDQFQDATLFQFEDDQEGDLGPAYQGLAEVGVSWL